MDGLLDDLLIEIHGELEGYDVTKCRGVIDDLVSHVKRMRRLRDAYKTAYEELHSQVVASHAEIDAILSSAVTP